MQETKLPTQEYSNMDKSFKNIEWKKPDTKKNIIMIPSMWK